MRGDDRVAAEQEARRDEDDLTRGGGKEIAKGGVGRNSARRRTDRSRCKEQEEVRMVCTRRWEEKRSCGNMSSPPGSWSR